MTSVFNALFPVVMIILLGVMLKKLAIFSDEAWKGFENLCYFVLFPALLIKTLATAELGNTEIILYAGMVLFAILAMSAMMFLLYPLLVRQFGVKPGSFTSLFQGATRWHGFIALSIVGVLFGDEGVAYMAIIMAVIIPPLNIINVAVLAKFAGNTTDISQVFIKLLRNPFIIACLIGATLNQSGIGLPPPLGATFNIMGNGALGLGILTVGAGLHFGKIVDHRIIISFGTTLRLIGMPCLMFLGAWLFEIEGMPRTVAIIAAAVPTASTSYVLARQMGGDATLMANLITAQVMFSAITLPIMIWIAGL